MIDFVDSVYILYIDKNTGETDMWYVIQTLGGEEEKTADMIRKSVSSRYIKECFIPKRERMKKFHGCWNKVEEVLFRGYVFVSSEYPEEVYQRLKQIPKLTKILGKEEDYFVALSEEEERLVRGITDEEHKTSISKIQVEEGKTVRVLEGPLKDYVGNVVKVDLHKREAVVRVEFMGRPLELKMGIEMVDGREIEM